MARTATKKAAAPAARAKATATRRKAAAAVPAPAAPAPAPAPAKVKWRTMDDGKVRSDLGTARKLRTGWFFYRKGSRKATNPVPFASRKAVLAHAEAL